MSIEKNYTIAASKDVVFDAWISNDYLVAPVAHADVERRVGGRFHLRMSEETGGGLMRGTFTHFDSPNRLAYEWVWDWSPNVSIVDVSFSTDGESTAIHLTHEGLDSDDSVSKHSAGWDAYIEGLRKQLE